MKTGHSFEIPDWRAREQACLAPWAMHAADTAGRIHPEPPHPFRSPYQRDRDRIVHSAAFRRLAHKTQVFTGYHGDYHRSRLTHTLEVTNWGGRKPGDRINLEVDMMARYAARLAEARAGGY
jgi:dGTPase